MIASGTEFLIDRIHEAGLIPSIWPTVLGELSDAVGGNGGFLFASRDTYVRAVVTPQYDDVIGNFMNGGWADLDLTLKRATALNHPGFVNDGDLLSDEEIATD